MDPDMTYLVGRAIISQRQAEAAQARLAAEVPNAPREGHPRPSAIGSLSAARVRLVHLTLVFRRAPVAGRPTAAPRRAAPRDANPTCSEAAGWQRLAA